MDFQSKNKNLDFYKKLIDNSLTDLISKEPNELLKNIFNHSLSGGKRIRPIISILVFLKFKKHRISNLNPNFFLIPELIHNVSLIIDDLPCMDDDNYRRNKETTHYKYGIIPSYISIVKLINNLFFELESFVNIQKKIKLKNDKGKIEYRKLNSFFIDEISDLLTNLIEGQYYDLQFMNLDLDIEILFKINSRKTSPLFSLSFILGYILNIIYFEDYIIEFEILEELKKIGELFGLIFQMNDDIVDRDQDKKEGKYLNLSLHMGEEESIKFFNDKCHEFISRLKKIGLNDANFLEIITLLKKRINYK